MPFPPISSVVSEQIGQRSPLRLVYVVAIGVLHDLDFGHVLQAFDSIAERTLRHDEGRPALNGPERAVGIVIRRHETGWKWRSLPPELLWSERPWTPLDRLILSKAPKHTTTISGDAPPSAVAC